MAIIDTESHFDLRFMKDEPYVPITPLSALRTGEIGHIHSVVGASDFVRRLAELGLSSGAEIEMVRPGTTCILRINNAKICIRGDELLRVMISPLPMAARHSA